MTHKKPAAKNPEDLNSAKLAAMIIAKVDKNGDKLVNKKEIVDFVKILESNHILSRVNVTAVKLGMAGDTELGSAEILKFIDCFSKHDKYLYSKVDYDKDRKLSDDEAAVLSINLLFEASRNKKLAQDLGNLALPLLNKPAKLVVENFISK